MTDVQHDGGVDHYREIIRAMKPGLLITVNNSGGARGPGSPELRVCGPASGGMMLLTETGSSSDTYHMVRYHRNGVVLERLDDEGRGVDETYIQTIEVIGVAE